MLEVNLVYKGKRESVVATLVVVKPQEFVILAEMDVD